MRFTFAFLAFALCACGAPKPAPRPLPSPSEEPAEASGPLVVRSEGIGAWLVLPDASWSVAITYEPSVPRRGNIVLMNGAIGTVTCMFMTLGTTPAAEAARARASVEDQFSGLTDVQTSDDGDIAWFDAESELENGMVITNRLMIVRLGAGGASVVVLVEAVKETADQARQVARRIVADIHLL